MTRMTTEEALKIFTLNEIDKLTVDNLKTIKKEFLLEFQLTDQPVVVFNGHTVDKNAVIEIFEHLRLSLEKHLEKHKSIVIDTFLSSGDITYLLNEGIGKRIVKAIVSLPEKRVKLLAKLSELIADTFLTPREDREHLLGQIQKLTNSLPLDYEEKAFSASFRYLRNEVESIKTRYDNPFYDNFTLQLEPELQTMIDLRFLKLFQLLPKKFQFLSYEYSLWCYDFVIKLTKNREKDYAKYPIDSLLVIRNAALIASEYYEETENLKLSSYITTLLKAPAKLVKNDKARYNQNKKEKKKKHPFNISTSSMAIIGFLILLMTPLYIISNKAKKSSQSYKALHQIDREIFKSKNHIKPQFLQDVLPDTSFKYIGFSGKKMTYVSPKSRHKNDIDQIQDVVLAIAKPNPFNGDFRLSGEFEVIYDLRIEDLNGDTIYKSSRPYAKDTKLNFPKLIDGTYLIRGYTDRGHVLTELIRKNE